MESKKENEKYDHSFKVILIGSKAAGKTNIISRFQKNEFNSNSKTTIGAEFANIILEIKGKKIQLQTWRNFHLLEFCGTVVFIVLFEEKKRRKVRFQVEYT
ncbi:ras-related protein rab11c [Anaeramoeba ignava]|uniref:Ras-related protein rab11c n=1 Tax=Anaeramoeba ignava TaxID=1746090 RepID=A0A9Q0RF24_ANAIG|nr:ras-related protein rab11c [Anaeramoeba ignava]